MLMINVGKFRDLLYIQNFDVLMDILDTDKVMISKSIPAQVNNFNIVKSRTGS